MPLQASPLAGKLLHDQSCVHPSDPNSLTNYLPHAKLIPLVDLDPHVREATGDRFGINARFDSLEAALNGVYFNAVIHHHAYFYTQRLGHLGARDGQAYLL